VISLDGDPWFVALDVCAALGMDTRKGTNQWLAGLSNNDK
jgi:prophage antirepressor-like protein